MRPFALVLASAAVLFGCASSREGSSGSGGGGTGAASGTGGEASTASAGGSGGGAATGSASAAVTGATSSSSASTGSGGPQMVPFGGSSGGSGGPAPVAGSTETASGISYHLIVPSSYAGAPTPFLLVYSGTEGGSVMTMNLQSVAPSTGTSGFIEAILDGVTYYGDGAAGATVLDAVRAAYDIDNDRTYLLGESAGTSAAEALGFHLRSPYFAAYWANDVNNPDTPGSTAAQLGFAPWGQVGPGGDTPDADTIVAGMQAAGYRLPNPAPYAGPGSTTHGDPNQFIAAIQFFPGKTRQ